MSDPELAEIRDKIAATELKLASAEVDGKDSLIVVYVNRLTEQQKTLNILLTGAGNLILYGSNHS